MRYITLTAIAPPWWEAPAGMTNEQLIERMMALWRAEIDAVLPEKPDLILLPEVCDRYANLSAEQNRAYYDARGDRMRDFFAGVARENGCCIAYSACVSGRGRLLPQLDAAHRPHGPGRGNLQQESPGGERRPAGRPAPDALRPGRGGFRSGLRQGRLRDLLRPELLRAARKVHGRKSRSCCCSPRTITATFTSSSGRTTAAATSPAPCAIRRRGSFRRWARRWPPAPATITTSPPASTWTTRCATWTSTGSASGPRARSTARKSASTSTRKTGAVLLTSETDEFSAMDVVREFGIELMDDYFERSRRDERERVEP